MFRFDPKRKGQCIGKGHYAEIWIYLDQEEEKIEPLLNNNQQGLQNSEQSSRKSKYLVKVINTQGNERLRQFMEEFTIGFNNRHPFVLNYHGFDFKEIEVEETSNLEEKKTEAKKEGSEADINKSKIWEAMAKFLPRVKRTNTSNGPGTQKEYEVYIKMKAMKCSLKDRIKSRKIEIEKNPKEEKFTLKEVILIFFSLASALKYLQNKGVLHGNVVPDSVLFDENDDVKLAGFAFSKFKPWKHFEHRVNQSYWTPESGRKIPGNPKREEKSQVTEDQTQNQVQGEGRKKDKTFYFKSDVWCLGRLIIDICLLEPNVKKWLTQEEIQNKLKQIEEEYGKPLADILRELLDEAPEKRPTFDQILQNLQKKYEDFQLFEMESVKIEEQNSFVNFPDSDEEEEEEKEEHEEERSLQRPEESRIESNVSQARQNENTEESEHPEISTRDTSDSQVHSSAIPRQNTGHSLNSYHSMQASFEEARHLLDEAARRLVHNNSANSDPNNVLLNSLGEIVSSLRGFEQVYIGPNRQSLTDCSNASTQNSVSPHIQSVITSIANFSRQILSYDSMGIANLSHAGNLSNSLPNKENPSEDPVSNMILQDLDVKEPGTNESSLADKSQ